MIKKYSKSSFVKNSTYMIVSTVGTQLIVVLTIPILTRLFNPDFFGYHATYRSVLVILSIILTLKLETAVVLPKTLLKKVEVVFASFMNIGVVSIILISAYFIIKLLGFDLLEITFGFSNKLLLICVILGSVAVALSNISQSFLVSQEDFRNLSFSRLIVPVSFFLISYFFYYSFSSPLSLIIAHFLSYILLNIFLKSRYKINFSKIKAHIYRSTLIRFKDITTFTTSNSLLNTVSNNAPSLLLLGFYGATPLGFYAIGSKIISLPTQLLSASLGQIFYKKFVDIYNTDRNKLYPFVKKVYYSLLLIGIITFSFLYVVIPYVIPFFLGAEWLDAVPIIKYLCFWQALVIVNNPISTLTILLKKQKTLFIYESFLLLARFLALWVPFTLNMSFNNAVLTYALVGLFFNIILMLYLLQIARKVGY